MTATDELRRLLDERGVFWVDIPRKDMTRTVWKESDGQLGYCYFDENEYGVTTLLVSSPTPEQAVTATLAYIEAEREVDRLQAENAELWELVTDMWNEGMCECGSRGKCARCEYGYPDRMRELGIEVK